MPFRVVTFLRILKQPARRRILASVALSLADAIASAQQGHRNYAKRQMTWFRREPEVHWLRGFGDSPETESAALALTQDFLSP